jgi:hypothetical protein
MGALAPQGNLGKSLNGGGGDVSSVSSSGRAFASGRNSDSSTVLPTAVTLPHARPRGHPVALRSLAIGARSGNRSNSEALGGMPLLSISRNPVKITAHARPAIQ